MSAKKKRRYPIIYYTICLCCRCSFAGDLYVFFVSFLALAPVSFVLMRISIMPKKYGQRDKERERATRDREKMKWKHTFTHSHSFVHMKSVSNSTYNSRLFTIWTEQHNKHQQNMFELQYFSDSLSLSHTLSLLNLHDVWCMCVCVCVWCEALNRLNYLQFSWATEKQITKISTNKLAWQQWLNKIPSRIASVAVIIIFSLKYYRESSVLSISE